jgi:hypothetical protein
MDSVDLTDVKSANILVGWQEAPSVEFAFEARLDAPAGKLLGKGKMSLPKKGSAKGFARVSISPVTGGKLHGIYFVYKPSGKKSEVAAGISGVQFNGK